MVSLIFVKLTELLIQRQTDRQTDRRVCNKDAHFTQFSAHIICTIFCTYCPPDNTDK